MKKTNESYWRWLIGRFRTRLLSGILVVVPIAAAILVIVWVFNTIDNLLQPVIQLIFGHHIIGLGFLATVVLIFLAGIFAGNYFGKKIVQFTDFILQRVPVFKQIYNGVKQVLTNLSGTGAINKAAFREVVFVEFPSKGMHTVAFLTNEITTENGDKLYAVYIPTTPVPWSGFSGLLTEEQLTRTDISIDDALRMCISGMMIFPESINIQDTSGKKLFNIKYNQANKPDADSQDKVENPLA